MPHKKGRLYPQYGGEPLPWAPIVVPGLDSVVTEAKRYLAVLDQELAEADDTGKPKWSGAERQHIRRLRATWYQRAQGQDAHYTKHGTFRRPPNAAPPTIMDKLTEQRRRKAKEDGTYLTNRAHKARWQISAPHQLKKIIRGLQQTHGTGTKTPSQE